MKAKFLLVAATAAALAGCGGSKDASAPPPTTSTPSGATTTTTDTSAPPSPSAPPDRVLAATAGGTGNEVFWADGTTLEPLDDHRVKVPFFMSVGQLSPDGSLLAIGGSETGNVQFVDV